MWIERVMCFNVYVDETPVNTRCELAGRDQGQFAHSSLPSVKIWCFHTGSRALTSSTRALQVSNASRRWSADTAQASATSPTWSGPTRWLTETARTPVEAAATFATIRSMIV